MASVAARRLPSLVDQVASELGRQIRSGRIAPGAMLPSVSKLSESRQVSRTVVREALARLAATGLVTSRQGRGVFAAEVLPAETLKLSATEVDDDLARILELRLGIETEAAGLAALRRSGRHLAQMRKALETMAAGVDAAQIDKGIEADVNFHRAICIATGNEHFEKLFVFLSQFLRRNISVSRRMSATVAGRGMAAQQEHEAIFAAIEAGAPDRARAEARRHVVNTARRLGLAHDFGDVPSASEALGRG